MRAGKGQLPSVAAPNSRQIVKRLPIRLARSRNPERPNEHRSCSTSGRLSPKASESAATRDFPRRQLAIELLWTMAYDSESGARVTIKPIKTKETQGSARAPHQDIR